MGTSTAAKQLRKLRLKADLTQEQLAVKAGLTSKTVANIERDRFSPHNGTLLLLANALGCDVADLTGAEPEEIAA